MEKLRIIEDTQGNTRMVEINTRHLDPSDLKRILSGQLETPNRCIVLVGTKKSIPITPQVMGAIKGKPAPERERLEEVITSAMAQAQLLLIFTTK